MSRPRTRLRTRGDGPSRRCEQFAPEQCTCRAIGRKPDTVENNISIDIDFSYVFFVFALF